MINKFHTIEELKNTGLEMIGSCISDKHIPINQRYLQPTVISMWDFKDYSNYYTYFDSEIKFVVKVCFRSDEKTTKSEFLNKDLSNI